MSCFRCQIEHSPNLLHLQQGFRITTIDFKAEDSLFIVNLTNPTWLFKKTGCCEIAWRSTSCLSQIVVCSSTWYASWNEVNFLFSFAKKKKKKKKERDGFVLRLHETLEWVSYCFIYLMINFRENKNVTLREKISMSLIVPQSPPETCLCLLYFVWM